MVFQSWEKPRIGVDVDHQGYDPGGFPARINRPSMTIQIGGINTINFWVVVSGIVFAPHYSYKILGFPWSWVYPKFWMVDLWENAIYKWMITGGTAIYGTPHLFIGASNVGKLALVSSTYIVIMG